MKKRLRFIYLLVAFTAMGIIACQLYWVYFNYRTAQTNFTQTAVLSLRQSIDSCLLAQSELPASLSEAKPSLGFMMTKTLNPVSPGGKPADTTYSVRFFTVGVDEDQLPGVRALVARLFSLQSNKSISLDTLSHFFHRELQRNGIPDSFDLSLDTNTTQLPSGEIAAVIHFNKEPAVVKASIRDRAAFLFRMNIVPALVSTILILLSAGCLFYMWRVIRWQVKLDSMKTDFVNNVVHELRTPLTILRSSNEALASFGAAKDERSLNRYLGINAQIIEDLDGNIERILNFSRSEQGVRIPVLEMIDLVPVLEQVQLRFTTVNDASISLQVEENPFEVRTDRFMLGVILSNLVDNAVKYSLEDPLIRIIAGRKGQGWQLTVSDNGMGIPGSSLPYIFDKFYRVPTGDLHETKGYGIGLAYVKQLVSDLNGKIAVDSKPGQGTTFTITFFS